MVINKNTYEGMSCKVLHEGALTDKIKVKTVVRQGCLLPPFLFLLVRKEREMGFSERYGNSWTIWTLSMILPCWPILTIKCKRRPHN